MMNRMRLIVYPAPHGLLVLLAGCAALFAVACNNTSKENAMQETPKENGADLVIINARVWTGREPFASAAERAKIAADPQPTAIAIGGQHILAVGNDPPIRDTYVGRHTRVIDAGGRRVIPGITDSHTHIISGGFQLARVELRDVAGKDEFIAAVRREAEARKPGEWVEGGRWSIESWRNPETPHRSWLDSFSAGTPIFLNRMDGHGALVNTAALRIAGIDASGPADPVGGEIERDPVTREPTGILKESAMDLVTRHIPAPSAADRRVALDRAMKHANALGVTSVHDMSDWDDLAVFEQTAKEKKLTIRVTSYVQSEDWLGEVDRIVDAKMRLVPNREFNIAGLKGYMDGSMGSRTACMHEPFSDVTSDEPYPRGQLTAFSGDRERFRRAVNKARLNHRLDIAIHAIGDEANHLLLDAYTLPETGGKFHVPRTAIRIEHAQHLMPSDIPRFKEIGAIASMQPFHKADDARYVEKAIGKERLKGSYAFRSLIDAGALVIFGSDWPVVTINPFAGIHVAVTAMALDGKIFMPEEAISVEEALVAYTSAPALAIGQQEHLGQIKATMLADLVILTEDPFPVAPEALGGITAHTTIMNGKVVYEAAR